MNRIILLLLLFFSGSLHSQFLLFPGDANNDGVANYIDVLPIGLAYGEEGPSREIPSTDWLPQQFFPFGQILPFSGVEYGFIDCDGNGIIDSLDIEAIALNYDSIQNMANPPPMPYTPSDTLFTTNIPELSVSFQVDTVFVSDTIRADIDIVYSDPINIEPALGVALGLEYDAEFVKDSLTLIFPDTISDDLMFVSAASNFLSFWRLPSEGRIELGAAGRGQNAINNTRTIATAMIIIEDIIVRSEGEIPFYFTLSDIMLLNANEQVLEINFHSDTLLLLDTLVNANELIIGEDIKVYPNPSRGYLTLESEGANIEQVRLINQMGQEVSVKDYNARRKVRFDALNIPRGIYILHIKTAKGWLIRKVVFMN